MIKYSVVDLSRDGYIFCLRDQLGHLHVARGQGQRLDREAELLGREAKLGNHVLMAADTHVPMHVNFEAVGCTQLQALALLHPAPGAQAALH